MLGSWAMRCREDILALVVRVYLDYVERDVYWEGLQAGVSLRCISDTQTMNDVYVRAFLTKLLS
jgi:hypothetical protein